MASALALQCSTNWAMKTHMLGADRFTEFIFTRDGKETWNEVNLSCGNRVEIEMGTRLSANIHQGQKLEVCCLLPFIETLNVSILWDGCLRSGPGVVNCWGNKRRQLIKRKGSIATIFFVFLQEPLIKSLTANCLYGFIKKCEYIQ